MTNGQVLELFTGLNEVKKIGGNVKFAFAVAKNVNILKPEIEGFEKALEQSEEYKKYETERIELAKLYSEKDEKGEPKINGNNYVIADQKVFDKELDKLKEHHKEALDARETQLKEFEGFLKEENPIQIHKVLFENVPVTLNAEQLLKIFPMIDDDSEKPKV